MDVIRLVATVGADQVIQPLGDLRLPAGMVDVTVKVRPILSAVLPAAGAPEPAGSVASLGAMPLELAAAAERTAPALPADLGPTRDWLPGIAATVATLDPPPPPDMAINHDHHAPGKPLS